jgi:integrase
MLCHGANRSDFAVQMVVFADGERCPMLVDKATGLPVFDTTVWAMMEYRRSSASIMEQALRGAMLVHLFCSRQGIDLGERVRTGVFLEPRELDALEMDASMRKPALAASAAVDVAASDNGERPKTAAKPRARSGRFLRRLPSVKKGDAVESQTKSLRLTYARAYLKWLGDRHSFRIGRSAKDNNEADRLKREYEAALEKLCNALKTRSKSGPKSKRLALTPEQRTELLRVTDPDCAENPWVTPFVRLRNRLIILLLLGTGIRRGEMLGVKQSQLELARKRARIVRNQDDRTDPRKRQPQVKTVGRLVPLGDDVIVLTLRYIKQRAKIEAAKKHGFLFVSELGSPLSLSALTEIFAELRREFGMLKSVTAQVLRHTWNEVFSDEADEIGMDPNEERRVRIELMGWSPTSTMPEYYLRRKTIQRSSEASKRVQLRVMRDAEEARKQMREDDELGRFLLEGDRG